MLTKIEEPLADSGGVMFEKATANELEAYRQLFLRLLEHKRRLIALVGTNPERDASFQEVEEQIALIDREIAQRKER